MAQVTEKTRTTPVHDPNTAEDLFYGIYTFLSLLLCSTTEETGRLVGSLPDEEAPQCPAEDEDDAQEPALGDEEGDGQHDGPGVVFDYDEELGHGDGRHQPRLLPQLPIELPEGGRSRQRRRI